MGQTILIHANESDGARQLNDIYGHRVLAGAGAKVSRVRSKFGDGSVYLSGQDDSELTVKLKPKDSRGGGHRFWALDFWIYPLTKPANTTIAAMRSTTAFPIGWELRWNAFSQLSIYYWLGFASFMTEVAFGKNPALNTWTHLAIGGYPSGSNYYLFMADNGSHSASNIGGTNRVFHDNDADLVFGPLLEGTERCSAYIDEIRFQDKIHTYTGNFTPETAEYSPLDPSASDRTVDASTLIAATSTPTENYEVWTPDSWFSNNWVNPPVLRHRFATRILGPREGNEKRTARMDRPSRSIEVSFSAYDREQLRSLLNQARRWAKSNTLVPLFSDRGVLTSAESSGVSTLQVDTTQLRMFPGQRVLIVDNVGDCKFTNYEVVQIDEVSASNITLVSPTGSSHPINATLYPLIECLPMPTSDLGLPNSRIAETTLVFREAPGPTAMPPQQVAGGYPSSFPDHVALPILNSVIQNPRVGFDSRMTETALGNGVVFDAMDNRSRITITGTLRGMTRAECLDLVKFFEGRMGRHRAFWALSPTDEYVVSAISSNTMTVNAVGDVSEWADHRRYVGILRLDGGVEVVKVVSVTPSGSDHVLTLDRAPTSTLSDVREATRAFLARFGRDEIAEVWRSDNVCDMSIEVVEVLSNEVVSAGINAGAIEDEDRLTETPNFDCGDGTCGGLSEDNPLLDVRPGTDGQGGTP